MRVFVCGTRVFSFLAASTGHIVAVGGQNHYSLTPFVLSLFFRCKQGPFSLYRKAISHFGAAFGQPTVSLPVKGNKHRHKTASMLLLASGSSPILTTTYNNAQSNPRQPDRLHHYGGQTSTYEAHLTQKTVTAKRWEMFFPNHRFS